MGDGSGSRNEGGIPLGVHLLVVVSVVEGEVPELACLLGDNIFLLSKGVGFGVKFLRGEEDVGVGDCD